MSKICLYFVHLIKWYLDESQFLSWTIIGQCFDVRSGLKWVHVIPLSRLCPPLNMYYLRKNLLHQVWTNLGSICTVSVQVPLGWTRFWCRLYFCLVFLDCVWTDLVPGLTLDRDLTGFGQRLDLLSNVCLRFVWPHDEGEYPIFRFVSQGLKILQLTSRNVWHQPTRITSRDDGNLMNTQYGL